MQHEPYRLIPLRDRNWQVAAHALVSEEDYERVNRLRWHLHHEGYVMHNLGRADHWRKISMHRFVMGIGYGDPLHVDHINGNRSDNRRSNLRFVTHAQNQQNRRSRPGKSIFPGVSPNSGGWEASATVGGRKHYLGWFKDQRVAGEAVAAFRIAHMPFSREAATGGVVLREVAFAQPTKDPGQHPSRSQAMPAHPPAGSASP